MWELVQKVPKHGFSLHQGRKKSGGLAAEFNVEPRDKLIGAGVWRFGSCSRWSVRTGHSGGVAWGRSVAAELADWQNRVHPLPQSRAGARQSKSLDTQLEPVTIIRPSQAQQLPKSPLFNRSRFPPASHLRRAIPIDLVFTLSFLRFSHLLFALHSRQDAFGSLVSLSADARPKLHFHPWELDLRTPPSSPCSRIVISSFYEFSS